MAVEGGFISIDYRVMAIDSHYPVIMRDREGEYLLVKLIFTLYKSKEPNNTPHR
jgi:hypothetical protein